MKHLTFYQCNILFLVGCCTAEGLVSVELSPPSMALVCIGQQIELICASNASSFLIWNFMLTNEQGIFRMYERIISLMDASQQSSHLMVNSTSFNFARSSAQNSSPIMSSMSITVTNGTDVNTLNGTEINCTGVMGSTRVSTSTTIHANFLSPPEVSISRQFEINTVSITLQWTPQIRVTYNVTAVPAVDVIIRNSDASLSLLYNTAYNVSIMATSLCGQTTITYVELYHATCEYPLHLVSNNGCVKVTGYKQPAIEGTIITLSCSHGLIFTGPAMSTCMENGEWEPDAREGECKAISNCNLPLSPPDGYFISYNGTAERINVTIFCQTGCQGELQTSLDLYTAVCSPSDDRQTSPADQDFSSGPTMESTEYDGQLNYVSVITPVVVSLAVTFLATSVFIFVIGFICGRCCGQKYTTHNHPSTNHPIPLYEAVQLNTIKDQERDLELKENEAYGLPKPMIS